MKNFPFTRPVFRELEGIMDSDKTEDHEIFYQQCDPTDEDAIPKSEIKFNPKNALLKDVTMVTNLLLS